MHTVCVVCPCERVFLLSHHSHRLKEIPFFKVVVGDV